MGRISQVGPGILIAFVSAIATNTISDDVRIRHKVYGSGGGNLTVDSSIISKKRVVSLNPFYVLAYDSANDTQKVFYYDSISVGALDSARAAWKADTAIKASWADSAGVFVRALAENRILWYGEKYPGDGLNINSCYDFAYNKSGYPHLRWSGDRILLSPYFGATGQLIFDDGATAWIIRKKNDDSLVFSYTDVATANDSSAVIVDTIAAAITKNGIAFADSSRAAHIADSCINCSGGIGDSARAAWKADTAGKADTSRATHVSDTAYKAWYADTAGGADRLGGKTKAYYDTVGNGAIYCDTPYIPKSVQSGSAKYYSKSILRERSNYVEVTGYDTAFTALNAPDDYYVGMAVDTEGNVYAISSNSGDLYKQTGGSGDFIAQGLTGRTYYHLVVDPLTNNLYTTVYNDGVYRRLSTGGDFASYGMSSQAVQYGITITQSRDMFVAQGTKIYKQTGLSGAFDSITALSPSVNVTGLFSIEDTVFVFTNNSGVYRLPPEATELVSDGQLTRYYQDAWIDANGNVYVAVTSGGPTSAGIYKRPVGGKYFDLMFSSSNGWRDGAFYNNNLYACVYSSDGDIYTSQANYSQLYHRFNVNGSMTVTGNIQMPFKNNGNEKIVYIASDGNIDTTDLRKDFFHGDSIIVDTIDDSIHIWKGGVKLSFCVSSLEYNPDSVRAAWKADSSSFSDSARAAWKADTATVTHFADSSRRCGDSVYILTYADSITIDATLADIYQVTLTGNTYMKTPTGSVSGKKMIVRFVQDGTGSRTAAWDTSAFRFSVDLPTPTLSTGANLTDYFGYTYNATVGKWDLIGQVLGF